MTWAAHLDLRPSESNKKSEEGTVVEFVMLIENLRPGELWTLKLDKAFLNLPARSR